MSGIKQLIGPNVIAKDGSKIDVDALSAEGKTLGIYFSAHWCPPCRGFTPQLAAIYNKIKATAAGNNMDIVFVSSDKTEDDFKSYWDSMPWLALEFSDRAKKAELAQQFGVSGIPCLVVVDNNGKTLTKNGRRHAGSDGEGQKWPWTD